MNKTKSYLPIFTGFYESIFEPCEDSEIEHINEIRLDKNLKSINYDDCDFDYNDYYNRISIQLCEIVENELSDFINDIKFIKLDSPKYYNYTNDSIICIINPNKKSILNYIKNNFDLWSKYLKDNYTSYDGFISSYSNNSKSNDWNEYNIINGFHQLGSVLNFIAINEDITEFDLSDSIIDNYIECNNYNELTK